MKILYLWIENYKNLKEEELSFSSSFSCNYDKKTNKLDVSKKEILHNFFGKNINITAVVGENGSGKSNILKAIEQIILDEEQQLFNYILVYSKNKELNYISNMKIESSVPQKSINENFNTLVYKYKTTQEEQHQAHYYSSSYLNYIMLNKKEIANLLIYEYNQSFDFNITTFMYIPNQIEITLKDDNELIQEHINFIRYSKREEVKKLFLSFSQNKYHQFLVISYIRKYGIELDVDVIKNIDKLKALFNELDSSKFIEYFLKLSSSTIFDINTLSEEQKDIYIKNEAYFHFFHFDFIDNKDRRYNNLSHGEQTIFGQLLNIYFYALNNHNILFLFDEPEISLHPSWQRKYFHEVVVLLEALKKKYHFIFTTHSPFLLSDIPKENIVFLQQDKDTGASLNVTKKIDINPFGANIHTLLSHGFFMSDGLMGEFAKNKIDTAIKYLNKSELTDSELKYCEGIISVIGEPIIKNQLQRMIDSKRLSDIEVIKKQIKELQISLNSLEEK